MLAFLEVFNGLVPIGEVVDAINHLPHFVECNRLIHVFKHLPRANVNAVDIGVADYGWSRGQVMTEIARPGMTNDLSGCRIGKAFAMAFAGYLPSWVR